MTDETREKILDAAENRFRTYGFGKTTMAEIASDIDMSTANLYRYYENKLAIGSAMAERCYTEREQSLQQVLNLKDSSAAERLEQFVISLLDYMHAQFSTEPKVTELVDVIVKKRPDFVQKQIETDRQLILQLLASGQQSGEFDITDIENTAEYVLAALSKFSSPFFMQMTSYEELKRLASGVVSLILNGLIKR